jgi:hypothetical protein
MPKVKRKAIRTRPARPRELVDPDPAEHKCGCPESQRYRKALGHIVHIASPGTRAHRIARRALQ